MADISILIATQTQPAYEKSKEIARNLLNKYDARSLATGMRFSIITGRAQQSVVGKKSTSKIETLELVSKLKYSDDNPAEIKSALEFVKSSVFDSCTLEAKCTNDKPQKILLLLIDRNLEETIRLQAKDLSDSGVTVIVAVASDVITPDSPTVPVVGEKGKVLVYPLVGNNRDPSLSIVKLMEKGKF